MSLFDHLPEQAAPTHRACTLEPERSMTETWDDMRGKWVQRECWRHPDFPGWIAYTAKDARMMIKRMRESRR